MLWSFIMVIIWCASIIGALKFTIYALKKTNNFKED